MILEETLNGGYLGLVGEVVTHDVYKIKNLKFIPDVIIDLGANVGVFTRFARELFPNAFIVSVEPNEENFQHLVNFTPPTKNVFINKAIGIGEVWHGLTAANGGGETYLSSGLGYPKEMMGGESMEVSNIEMVMPDKLINTYVKDGKTFLIKIDIEGNEHTIFTHQPSMDAIKKADYICMEVHYYALTGDLLAEVKEKTIEALNYFSDTHNFKLEHINFWATKKNHEDGNTIPNTVS